MDRHRKSCWMDLCESRVESICSKQHGINNSRSFPSYFANEEAGGIHSSNSSAAAIHPRFVPHRWLTTASVGVEPSPHSTMAFKRSHSPCSLSSPQ